MLIVLIGFLMLYQEGKALHENQFARSSFFNVIFDSERTKVYFTARETEPLPSARRYPQ